MKLVVHISVLMLIPEQTPQHPGTPPYGSQLIVEYLGGETAVLACRFSTTLSFSELVTTRSWSCSNMGGTVGGTELITCY